MPRKGIAASGSTRLCLEVKERVARHVAMKRRDNVVPLRSKGTGIDPLSGLRISKDQFQEEISSSQISSAASSHASSSSHASDIERPPKPKATRRSQAPLKAQKTKATKKEKQAPITPIEYAQQLLNKAMTAGKRKSSAIKFLEGKNIFYIGGDMQFAGERTRGRMELIVKHGGNLIPAYDPAIVTHIVTDAPKPPTLRALGYKHLSEIPGHMPTVKWGWVLSAIGRTGRLDKEDIEAKMAEEMWLHAAFSERMDTTPDRSKSIVQISRGDRSTGAGNSEAPNRTIMSSSHQIRSVPFASNGPNSEPCSSRATPPHNSIFPSPRQPFDEKGKECALAPSGAYATRQARTDPLAEFYAEARAARENSWSRFGGCDESDNDIDPFIDDTTPRASLPRKKRGWTCDNKEPQTKACVNQDIIEKLQELQELHKAKPGDEDHWRAYSYSKSVRALRGYPKRIQSYSEAQSIRGVGEKTALKIMEILQTGDLRRINYEKTDDVEVTRLFQGIYGVGQSTAFKWYSAGCRTLEDLRNQKGGVHLNPVQLIGLQYYDDINSRMPRNEAKAIFELIKPIGKSPLSFDSKLFVEIMGSYRRGKGDCGDIDILITRPTDDDQTHLGILGRLLPVLHKAGIITEDLAIPEDLRDLECVYRGLCRLPQPGSRRRRIDILTVPWQSRGAALLYYTGDDIFNRAMRLKANKMGYSLNQRGLYSGIVRDPKDSRVKLNEGTIVASETEEEIFRILNVPWQEPHERVRG
ncbi:hypothetical protein P691DRAFT_732480 [Macrolepiota fuliginosa MF-IS2]|uniref:DNA polymerase lambda n=1 Tax=Macrolepiota fuliginosa MF-IS2 TaxID=1400762 RepID=A0A9P5XC38_9AGAR|nr:hypothetical protein P691DRAFT_732480 [Macrolepiota fuliginosa MF-IS2]